MGLSAGRVSPVLLRRVCTVLGRTATGSKAPAILVIGENVKLARGLDWLGAMKGRALDPDPLGRERVSETG